MGSKSPTWADQWGNGPFGNELSAEDHEQPVTTNKRGLGINSNKKMEQVKAAASTGVVKAKTAAVVGALKVKRSTSTGMKWLKDKCSSSSSSK